MCKHIVNISFTQMQIKHWWKLGSSSTMETTWYCIECTITSSLSLYILIYYVVSSHANDKSIVNCISCMCTHTYTHVHTYMHRHVMYAQTNTMLWENLWLSEHPYNYPQFNIVNQIVIWVSYHESIYTQMLIPTRSIVV